MAVRFLSWVQLKLWDVSVSGIGAAAKPLGCMLGQDERTIIRGTAPCNGCTENNRGSVGCCCKQVRTLKRG
jgi:hypothetical protein